LVFAENNSCVLMNIKSNHPYDRFTGRSNKDRINSIVIYDHYQVSKALMKISIRKKVGDTVGRFGIDYSNYLFCLIVRKIITLSLNIKGSKMRPICIPRLVRMNLSRIFIKVNKTSSCTHIWLHAVS